LCFVEKAFEDNKIISFLKTFITKLISVVYRKFLTTKPHPQSNNNVKEKDKSFFIALTAAHFIVNSILLLHTLNINFPSINFPFSGL
jgi:hypothetical protein